MLGGLGILQVLAPRMIAYSFVYNVRESQLFDLRHREGFMEGLRPMVTFFAFYMRSGKRTGIKCYGIAVSTLGESSSKTHWP